MTFKKPLLALILLIGASYAAFGQGFGPNKEDAYSLSTDPVKTVQIFPNPSTEFVHVKFETPYAKKVKLSVHNILGNVMDVEQELMDEHEIRLKVKDLPSGYYLVSIKDERGNAGSTFKFLKR